MTATIDHEKAINEARVHQKAVRRLLAECIEAGIVTPGSDLAQRFIAFDNAMYRLVNLLLAEREGQQPSLLKENDPTE